MKTYLFKGLHRAAFLLAAILYTAHALYNQYLLGGYAAPDPETLYRPYSQILFVWGILLCLFFMKKKNWQTKMHILTITVLLTVMSFVTTTQLTQLHNSRGIILDMERTSRTQDFVNWAAIENMSHWVANELTYVITYRVGKIILFDILAIFAFFAISKVIKESQLSED